jgi:hypothetical protein
MEHGGDQVLGIILFYMIISNMITILVDKCIGFRIY